MLYLVPGTTSTSTSWKLEYFTTGSGKPIDSVPIQAVLPQPRIRNVPIDVAMSSGLILHPAQHFE